MARVDSSSRGFERQRDSNHDHSKDTSKKDWRHDDGEDRSADS